MDGPREYHKQNKSDRERQIPNDCTYMCNLKNKTNKQNRNRLIDTKNNLRVARWEGGEELSEKGKGVKKLQNSHGDVKYSIRNIVNNIIITVYHARQVLELSGGIML